MKTTPEPSLISALGRQIQATYEFKERARKKEGEGRMEEK